MDEHETGPVSVAEAEAVVAQLRQLAGRAAEHRQATFHFVFSLTAESLADNVDAAAEWGDDGAE